MPPEIPVISQPDMNTGLTQCSCCGSEQDVKIFAIKVSPETRQIVAFCKAHGQQVAEFFLQAWEDDEAHCLYKIGQTVRITSGIYKGATFTIEPHGRIVEKVEDRYVPRYRYRSIYWYTEVDLEAAD